MKHLRTALALLVTLAALACSGGTPPPPATPRQVAPPLEPVRVVHGEKGPAFLPYWMAIEADLFARNGLRPNLQEIRDPQVAYARLLAGDADIYLAPLAPGLVAQAAGGADLAVVGGTPELAMVTTRRFLATREFILERFLRGVLEGIHAVQARPAVARELLLRQGGLSTAGEADAALAAYQAKMERVPYLAAADLEPLIAALATSDPRAEALEAERLLDQTLLRRLESSGFVAALYRA